MDTLERIVRLRNEGVRFAVATVVSRKAPVSSQLGDKALVYEDGTLEGFIGGACSREIIRRQALEALRLERPRLVRISPEPLPVAYSAGRDEICVPMTCSSEGALDVYIEPHVEKKRMVVVGGSPIAVALARQGTLQGYEVALFCRPDEHEAVAFGLAGLDPEVRDLDGFAAWLGGLPASRRGALEAVVASMGHYDEEALAALVSANPRYLGLVSSAKRGGTVMSLLEGMDISKGDLARVRNPAGLDLGAKTPNEVAVSILAEMILLRRQAAREAEQAVAQLAGPAAEAIDPVCGMAVAIETARHTADVDGIGYYFCCPNCRHRFLKDPARYLEPAS